MLAYWGSKRVLVGVCWCEPQMAVIGELRGFIGWLDENHHFEVFLLNLKKWGAGRWRSSVNFKFFIHFKS